LSRVLKLLPTLVLLAVSPWARLAGLLQYLEGDYPAAVSAHDQAELKEQQGFVDEAIDTARGLGPEAAPLLPRLLAVAERVKAGAEPEAVAKECRLLAREAISLGHVEQAPRRPPDLSVGQAQWEKTCRVCHGADGRADTELATTLKPPPANFHDVKRMATLTPYQAFNATAFGLRGTAMAPFSQYADDERWALAFYLFTFRQPQCLGEAPRASLEQLATSSDVELAQRFGEAAVPCLRRKLPALDRAAQLYAARDGVERALALHRAGKSEEARQAVVDAYLDGLEPIEPMMRARDAARVSELERAFTRTRLAAGNGPAFERESGSLVHLLDRTAAGSTASGFWSVLLGAMLIVLREGFEALVVVGALLAVLKKMGERSHARTVHLGWSSALIAGVVAFVLGHRLLAAADREWVETLVGFFAVAMLLYAALWLNRRANMSRFMGELREKMSGALGKGSALGLFVISFTAVGRESFETALFIEGLASDSPRGATWGAAAGLMLVGALVGFVTRVGFKLPMKTLFNASTVMLVATAVVLLGKAMHGLQELGVLPLLPLPFFELPALGVFSDGLTLVPQVLVALLPLLWLKTRASA
jgi:high-affinity iron transporter